MTVIRNKFDFEIGYLIKSPCRECERLEDIPECVDDCEIIDNIQSTLVGAVSSSKSHATAESFTVSMQDSKK